METWETFWLVANLGLILDKIVRKFKQKYLKAFKFLVEFLEKSNNFGDVEDK